jgi:hypothetical protein
VVKLGEKESKPESDYNSEKNKGKLIINVEPIATIMATIIQPKKLEEPKEGECLFHS